MRVFSFSTLTVAFITIGRALAGPIASQRPEPSGGPVVVHPGNAQDLNITSGNTVNGSYTSNSTQIRPQTQILATEGLPLSFVNNLAGGQVNAYVTGLDSNNLLVLLQADGSFYYPTVTSSDGIPEAITVDCGIPLGPQGSTTNITLPGYISSARVWFAQGELQFFTVQGASGPSLVEPSAINPSDPSANVNWGFVELTNTEEGGLYANISYVDFVGLVLGMQMIAGDGSVQSAPGLVADAVTNICVGLCAQAAIDGQPWDELCYTDESTGNYLRVNAPIDYLSVNPSAFSDYWTSYVSEVWAQYTNQPLIIDTQAAAGNVSCTVSDGILNCAGDNRGYTQPVAGDIFGCNSGPFAIEATDNAIHQAVVPRLCAAFDRSTLLLPGGNYQPSLGSGSYYTTTPTDWYSKMVHQYEVEGTGYAFSYDDVNPDGDVNQSGVVADANPLLLTITIGGPSSTTT